MASLWARAGHLRFRVEEDTGALQPATADNHNCESGTDRLWVQGTVPATAEYARLPGLPYNVLSKSSRAWALLQGPVTAPSFETEAPFNVQDSELGQARLRGAVLSPEWDPHGGVNYVSGGTRHTFVGPLHATTEEADAADPVPSLHEPPAALGGGLLLPPLLTVVHADLDTWHMASQVLSRTQLRAFEFLLQADVAGYLEPRLGGVLLQSPDSAGALVATCAAFASRCRAAAGAAAVTVGRMRTLRVPVAQHVMDAVWSLMTPSAVHNVQAVLHHVPALSFIGFGDTAVSAASVDPHTASVRLFRDLDTRVPEHLGQGGGLWVDGFLADDGDGGDGTPMRALVLPGTTPRQLVPLLDTPNMVVKGRLYRAVGVDSRPVLPTRGAAGVAPTVMEAGKLEVWATGSVARPLYDTAATSPWLRWNRIKQEPDGTVTRKLCAGAVGRGAVYVNSAQGTCQITRGPMVDTRMLRGPIAKGTFVEGTGNLIVTDTPAATDTAAHRREVTLRASMHGSASSPVCDVLHLATLTLCKRGTPRLSATARLSGPPACPTLEPLDVGGHHNVCIEQHHSGCRVRCSVQFDGDEGMQLAATALHSALLRVGNAFLEMDVRVRPTKRGVPVLDMLPNNVTLVSMRGRPDLAHFPLSVDLDSRRVVSAGDAWERMEGQARVELAVVILVDKGLKLLAKGLQSCMPEMLRLLRACRFGPYLLAPTLAPTLHRPSVVTRDGTRMWLAAAPGAPPGLAHFVWRTRSAHASDALPLTSARLRPVDTMSALPNAVLADGTQLWCASAAAVRVAAADEEARIVPRDDSRQTLVAPTGEQLWVVSGPRGALHFGAAGPRTSPDFTLRTLETMVALAGPVAAPRTHPTAPWTIRNFRSTVRMACPRGVPWRGARMPLADPSLGPNVVLATREATFELRLWATGTVGSFSVSTGLQPNATITTWRRGGRETCYCTLAMQTLPGGRLVFSFAPPTTTGVGAAPPPQGALAMPLYRNTVDGKGQAAALQGICAMATPVPYDEHATDGSGDRTFLRVEGLQPQVDEWRFDPGLVGSGNYTHADGSVSVLQGPVASATCVAPVLCGGGKSKSDSDDLFPEGIPLVDGFPPRVVSPEWDLVMRNDKVHLLKGETPVDFRQAWPQLTRLAVSQGNTGTCVMGAALNMFLCTPVLVTYMRLMQKWGNVKAFALDDVPAATGPLQDTLYFIFKQAHVAAVGGALNPLAAKWLQDTTVHVDANLRHKMQAGVDQVLETMQTLGGILPRRIKPRPFHNFATAAMWTMVAALCGSNTCVLPEALWSTIVAKRVSSVLNDLALPYTVQTYTKDAKSVPMSRFKWEDDVQYDLVGACVDIMPSGGHDGHLVAGVFGPDGVPCIVDSNQYVIMHNWAKDLPGAGRAVGARYTSGMPPPYSVTCVALYLETNLVDALKASAAFDSVHTACTSTVAPGVTILVQAQKQPGPRDGGPGRQSAEPDLVPGTILAKGDSACARDPSTARYPDLMMRMLGAPAPPLPRLVQGLDLFNCTWGHTKYKCKGSYRHKGTRLASGWGPAPTVTRTCPDGSEEHMWAKGTIGKPVYEYIGAWNWQRAAKAGAAPRWFRALRTKESSGRVVYAATAHDFAALDFAAHDLTSHGFYHVNAVATCPRVNRVWAFAMEPNTAPSHGVLRHTPDFNARVTFKGKVEALTLLPDSMSAEEGFDVVRRHVQDLRIVAFMNLGTSGQDVHAVNKIKVYPLGTRSVIEMECMADGTWAVCVVRRERRLQSRARTLQDIMHRQFLSPFVVKETDDVVDEGTHNIDLPFLIRALVNDDCCWRLCEEIMHYVLSECVPQGYLEPAIQPFAAGVDMRL
jgi:hypothetical protein